MIRNIVFVVICLSSLLLFGCAQMQANARVKEYKTLLDTMGGESKEDVVRRFGPPQERQIIGALEIWTYHQSLGVRGMSYVNPYAPYLATVQASYRQ